MRQVNLRDAKTHLSRLVEEAAAGEEIIIVRAGKPIAMLTSITSTSGQRRLGSMGGKIWLADDFDDPLPSRVLTHFEGDE